VLGFSIYGGYGYWNSRLHKTGRSTAAEAAEPIK